MNRQGMQSLSRNSTDAMSKTGTTNKIASTAVGVAVAFLVFNLAGCDKGETGPTAQQLLRQQQLRSSQQASATQTAQQQLDTALAFLEDENFIAAGEELSRILIADKRAVMCAMHRLTMPCPGLCRLHRMS